MLHSNDIYSTSCKKAHNAPPLPVSAQPGANMHDHCPMSFATHHCALPDVLKAMSKQCTAIYIVTSGTAVHVCTMHYNCQCQGNH